MKPHIQHHPEQTELSDEQTMGLLEHCLASWKVGMDTFDMARTATFRLRHPVPEATVANLLADYWSAER